MTSSGLALVLPQHDATNRYLPHADVAFPITFTDGHEWTGPSQPLKFKCANSRDKRRWRSQHGGITPAFPTH